MTTTPEMQHIFENHTGLPEGRAAYAFIVGDEVLICRIPREYGIVCSVVDFGSFKVAHGPTDEALTLMHENRVQALLDLKA